MKADKEHRVPLSTQAVKLLKSIQRLEGSELIFPAPRGGKLSDMALTAITRRMNIPEPIWIDPSCGRQIVPHGFRSTFRDWCSERTHYPRDLAEQALAHAIENKVESAYRRGDALEKRRAMMQEWANHCEVLTNG